MTNSCEHCGNLLPEEEEAYLVGREFTFAELHRLNRDTWHAFPLSMLKALIDAGFDTRNQPEGTVKWSVYNGRLWGAHSDTDVMAAVWVAHHGELTAVLTASEGVDGRLDFRWEPRLTSNRKGFDPIAMGM